MGSLNIEQYSLGECLVFPKHNKLIVEGVECKVEPKIIQVLCYLIEHQGEVVSRDEITQSLWPDTVIGLDVVTRAIFELRKILKDDPKNPKFIETIARKGYCFIYVPEQVNEQKSSDKSLEEKASKTLLINKYVVGFLIITIGLLSVLYIQGQSKVPKKSNMASLKVTLLTDIEEYSESPALSPDRNQVLFTAKKDFKEADNQLVLLNLTTQKQKVVNEGAAFSSIQWLSDSSHWYYVKCQKNKHCEVIKHSIESGKKQSIYQSEYPILYIALSEKFQYIFASRLVDNTIEIAEINRKNNEVIILDTPEKNNTRLVLGHEHKFLYFTSTNTDGSSHLYQYDIEQKKYQIISNQFSRLYGISLKDNSALWITGDLNGKKGLWSINLVNKEIKSEFSVAPGHTPAQVNAQMGHRNLIYTNLTRSINLGHTGNINIPNISDANSSMIDMNAAYSTESKAMYFSSNRNGLYDIWKYQGDDVERVTNISADLIERTIITKQENKMAFVSRSNSQLKIRLFNTITNVEISHVDITKKVFLLSWSNDQKQIYYSQFDEGQYNIYSLNTQTLESEKILLNAGAIAQESELGEYLYYGDMSNGQLMRKSSKGEVSIVFKLPESDLAGIMPHRLKVIGDSFYFVGVEGKKSVLKRYSFIDKTLKILHTLPNDIYVTDIIQGESTGVVFDRFSKMNSSLIQLH